MNKSVLALSTALSILAFSPAIAQETAPAPAAQVDCTQAVNANDPACVNQQQNNQSGATTDQNNQTTGQTGTTTEQNTTTGQSDSTTTTTTGQSDTTTTEPSTTTTGQSDSTTTTTTTGQSGTDATTTDTTGSTTPPESTTTTTTQSTTGGSLIVPAEQLNSAKLITSSDFVGKTVYDQTGENIGEVNDMVLSDDGQIHAVILGVGGFLGIGEKSVAVSVDAVQLVQDGDNQRLVVNATKEVLEAAPSYDPNTRRYAEGDPNAPATDMNATGTGTTTTTEPAQTQQ